MDNQTTASAPRSIIATVLFFDIVGYTKQSVDKQTLIKQQFTDQLAGCLGGIGVEERIILDTGDGAAIGFLQHPEDALSVALCFSKHTQENYPDMRVRTGIHLGPINVVRDMNGINNMVGDGINDAQRIMSFAGTGEIYVSRPYFDFVSRLNAEYESMFVYRGAQKDKHGRAHQVYEILQAGDEGKNENTASTPDSSGITLEPFNLEIPEPAPLEITPVEIAAPEPTAREENHFLSDLNAFLTDTAESPAAATATPAAPTPTGDASKTAPEPSPAKTTPEPAAARKPTASPKPKAQVIKNPHTQKSMDTGKQAKKNGGLLWAAASGGLLLFIVIALFAVPYVMPWNTYASRLEQSLSASLGMPVKIGEMRGHLLPSPQLEFDNISAGPSGALGITHVRAHLGFNSLFTASKPVRLLVVEGVQLDAAQLQKIAIRLNSLASNSDFTLETVEIQSSTLRIPGSPPIGGIAGTLNFTAQGNFARARLEGAGGKYQLEAEAIDKQPLQVSLNIRGASLPPFTAMEFDGLELQAETSRDSLLIRKLDGRILGGVLQGNGRVSWQSGWHAEGLLLAKTLTLGRLETVIEGDMDGEAQFVASSENFPGLSKNLLMRGSFQVGKGQLRGIDLIAAARQRSAAKTPETVTAFDAFSGEIQFDGSVIGLRGLTMQSPLLSALGSVDIRDKQLSGTLAVSYSKATGLRSARFQLGGSGSQPELR